MGGNDAVTGHIISTTIGGKNGEPKRVGFGERNSLGHAEFHDEGDTNSDLPCHFVFCRPLAIWLSELLELDHLGLSSRSGIACSPYYFERFGICFSH